MRDSAIGIEVALARLGFPMAWKNTIDVIVTVDRHRQAILAFVLRVGEPTRDIVKWGQSIVAAS
jgi:hypothetical protein